MIHYILLLTKNILLLGTIILISINNLSYNSEKSFRLNEICLHLVQCVYGGDYGFLIDDNHMVFNDMDAYHCCMLGCGYFAIPDYLFVKVWIRPIVLFPSFINLASLNISVYAKKNPGVVRH